MSNKLEELKKLRAEKKALREQEKALREEVDAGKEERKAARKQQAEARKQVREHKAAVRDLNAKIYSTFSEGNSEEVNELADQIMEANSSLVSAVRSFAEAAEQIENL